MSITVEPPRVLPVEHLSVSSLMLLAKCPEQWRRRYLDREYEAPSGKMVLGSAVHAAECQNFGLQIETGTGFTTEEVLDEFSDEWELRTDREEVEWGDDKPGKLKDSGADVLRIYHDDVASLVVPTHVERQFELSWPDVDWTLLGYLDLEVEDGAVCDLKVQGRRLQESEPLSALQPSAYLYARRAEENPAPRFEFHAMVRGKNPYAQVVPAVRTDRQLDAFADRVFMAAKEIEFRIEHDVWSYAVPGAWWCSPGYCGYWADCAGGGLK